MTPYQQRKQNLILSLVVGTFIYSLPGGTGIIVPLLIAVGGYFFYNWIDGI